MKKVEKCHVRLLGNKTLFLVKGSGIKGKLKVFICPINKMDTFCFSSS